MPAQSTEKHRAWLLPPDTKGKTPPGLYLIATPIGNLGDIGLRALDMLDACDLVVCEDTRITGRLLAYFGLKKPLFPYNDHNADQQRGAILEKLKAGQIVALVSDAGMPLISDPGYKLVRACRAQNIYVTSLPGANAPLAALQLSSLPTDQFCFLGFLPAKAEACRKMLTEWAGAPATLMAFETAPRLLKTLALIQDVLGGRDVAVVRELTKLYEEVRMAPVAELISHYKKEGPPKGEIVLVIGPGAAKEMDESDIENLLRRALKTMGTKEAAAHVAALTGRKRREIYDLALKLSKS